MPNARNPRKSSAARIVKPKKSNNKKAAPARKRSARSKSRAEPTVLESPGFQGKPKKLPRDTYPEEGSAADFACFGPPATGDGEFEDVRICDMGCFSQDGKDSNKYYHAAVVQHRDSDNWYTYFEWGRTGGTSRSFQFIACESEESARAVFAKQLHTKNDKRGEWVTVVGIRTLRAKKGKDCYLVRPLATRTTGLPDARNVGIKRGKKGRQSNRSADECSNVDPRTLRLIDDLRKATVEYTRKSMADSSIPTQRAIDDARSILGEARGRIAEIDDSIDAQIGDKRLMQLTRLMFSRIPRKKKVGAPPATWVLSEDNIQDWIDDLDAFESALRTVDAESDSVVEFLSEMNLSMCWVSPESKVGGFLHGWAPGATADRHPKIKGMEIANIWEVQRDAGKNVIPKAQKRILRSKLNSVEKPHNQPRARLDLPTKSRPEYRKSNTALLFHGTRGVNVNAILREALRLPDSLVAVALTGAKFGPGIYFADDWKKAADYTNAKGSAEAGRKGTVKGRHAFMFLADVVLGKPHVPDRVQGYLKPPRGHHSVFGKAGHSGVRDNEFAVYRADQARLRYLIEFRSTR